MRDLAEQIVSDTPEFERLAKEATDAWETFLRDKNEANAKRCADAVVALGDHCGKMNAYMRPALDAMLTLYGPPTPRKRRQR